MSTRANIAFYGDPSGRRYDIDDFVVILYRHWDGYPGGVVETLSKLFSDYGATRPGPWCPLAAASYFNECEESFQITTDRHGDIEWFYAVTEFGIFVYEYPMDFDDDDVFMSRPGPIFRMVINDQR